MKHPLPLQIFSLLNFALLFAPAKMRAQAIESPYNPKGNYQTWNVKGKVLPFLIGNGGGVSGFLGAEYGFLKNQSIGVDGYLLLQEDSDDHADDTAGVEHATGKYFSSAESAVLVDYRYYFSLQRLRKKGVVFYTLAYVRLGHISRHWDPLYPTPTTAVTQKENHRSAGIQLGSTIRLDPESRWCLDINAGIFEKDKTIVSTDKYNHSVTEKPVGPGFRLSVNLYVWFKRRVASPTAGGRKNGLSAL
jgi:hypothetical protein